jgi:hypothetical protein
MGREFARQCLRILQRILLVDLKLPTYVSFDDLFERSCSVRRLPDDGCSAVERKKSRIRPDMIIISPSRFRAATRVLRAT